jgi:hypothetical protein
MIFPLPTSGSLVWTGCAKADQACLLELRLGRGKALPKEVGGLLSRRIPRWELVCACVSQEGGGLPVNGIDFGNLRLGLRVSNSSIILPNE